MSDLPIYIALTTLLSIVGFILSALIIWTLLHRHRSPTSTFAWLMAILMLPYIVIPLFLLLGGRKLDRMVERVAKCLFAARGAIVRTDRGANGCHEVVFGDS